MKALWVGISLGALLAQTPAPERPPPNGWHCSPRGWITHGMQTPMQPCTCKRMDSDPQCEGPPSYDGACRSKCFESTNCACPVECMPAPPGAE